MVKFRNRGWNSCLCFEAGVSWEGLTQRSAKGLEDVGRRWPLARKDLGGYLIIFAMAVSPEDLAAGALALQVFIKNAKNVEIIVDVAFGAIPSILGIGAAGLLGSGIINTAREVRNSISLLKTVGPMAQLGWMAGKGLNRIRRGYAERWQQSDTAAFRFIGYIIGPELLFRRLRRR
jgi:hypothetical protein